MSDDRFSNRNKLAIFASYYKPHWKLFALDMGCAFGMSLIDLFFPVASRYSLQHYLPQGQYRAFALAMLCCFFAFMIRAVLQFIVTYWGHLLGVHMETDMRRDLFTHLQKLSFRFYDQTRTGHLMSRVVSDLFEIVELAHHGPEDLFISFITLTGSLIAMFLIRWQLALILLAVMPVILFLTIKQRKAMSEASLEVKRKTATINAGLENSISGIRVAKAFTNEDYEISKFARGNEQYRDAKTSFYKAMAVFQSGMEFSTSILNVIVIAVGGLFIAEAQMNLSDLVAFTLYINTFLQPIKRLVQFFEQYTTGMAGFERFIELMRVEPDIVDSRDAIKLSGVRGDIEFSHVDFAYSAELPVLRDLNLKVEAGHSLALVGPSGSGKTTICQLIPRFYEIQAGQITIDGKDIRGLTLASLRENIGIVQQDVFLFADTIKENIRYGRISATDEEIVAAAKRAEIHDFIMSLPNGYDTQVGERGVFLSGGQKQRVSIARIFLKNPPILILDEATSALDSATEIHIQRAFEELSRGRTSLIIAHRLSTIRSADEIIYIGDGGIEERGTHEELLAKGGLYAALYRAQYSSSGIE